MEERSQRRGRSHEMGPTSWLLLALAQGVVVDDMMSTVSCWLVLLDINNDHHPHAAPPTTYIYLLRY